MRAVAVKKIKSNPLPLVGVLIGFLVARRALRRRG
jgi:hypothetical protein